MDEGGEDGARQRALIVAAFRVPLNGENEVVAGGQFHGFDHVVLRRAGRDDEVVAWVADGLVMAGVHELLDGEPR